ncbi:Gfo/Idh/MocA family protein [Granulosicoccus antarcticus]|uniref:1,5-anhydro-D-fructose reductase n=1 Tax=Granulosicoccus antarcticus IMCC3135 TaxID=1192854 RepID=A0A2Z2NN82_9GAMM|nr:Gfo/Idh/MocA family oxidoreductase [Granulosicoccus antarcticus]ASJ71381.1 1,5-anhydro-D-fructose reductase [Granulosicoccus antarcticus IMCC3135]
MSSLNVLLVGTGRMAETHAQRFAEIPGVSVLAAVDVNADRVQRFSAMHGIAHSHTQLDEALAAHRLDAVSVVTPDALHAPVTLQCLAAGLPVLCEKPLSDSMQTSQDMVAAANRADVLNMVNLSYRVSGALHLAREWVDQGRIGEIRHVEASYRQSWLCSPYWGEWSTEEAWLWRLSTAHGSSGVLGDIGIHILDFVTAGVGMDITGLQCRLHTFDKAPENRIGEYVLDANDSCVLNMQMENGALGVVHMSRFQTGYFNDLSLTLHGTQGALQLSTGQCGDKLRACLGEDRHIPQWQDVEVVAQPDTFERFVGALKKGETGSPDFAHAALLQHYLQRCLDSHEQGRWLDCDPLR